MKLKIQLSYSLLRFCFCNSSFHRGSDNPINIKISKLLNDIVLSLFSVNALECRLFAICQIQQILITEVFENLCLVLLRNVVVCGQTMKFRFGEKLNKRKTKFRNELITKC